MAWQDQLGLQRVNKIPDSGKIFVRIFNHVIYANAEISTFWDLY
jgi:hypothetical protein